MKDLFKKFKEAIQLVDLEYKDPDTVNWRKTIKLIRRQLKHRIELVRETIKMYLQEGRIVSKKMLRD